MKRHNRQSRPVKQSNGQSKERRQSNERRQSKVPSGRIIIGRNSLREILRHDPQRIIKVFIAESHRQENSDRSEFARELRERSLDYEIVPVETLDKIAQSESHQSVVAVLRDRTPMGLKDFLNSTLQKDKSLVLLLDDLQDPHNLGAVLRAAECFAADAVLFSKNRGVAITPVVAKVSVGASELVNIIPVSNAADALRKFKDAGYWIVVADVGEGAHHLNRFEFPGRTVVVLGAEGKGPQKLIKDIADFRVFIPLFGKISSLNVSQAAAILLNHYRLQIT